MSHTTARTSTKVDRVGISGRLMDGSIRLAALTASWSAVSIGGFNVVDWLLGLTLAFALCARLAQRRPIFISLWMLAPGLAALIVEATAVVTARTDSFNQVMVFRVVLATAVIAVLVQMFAIANPRQKLVNLLGWWGAGIALSAVVAVLSANSLVKLDMLSQATGERLSGLAAHPNGLAFSLAIAFPVLLYFVRTATRRLLSIAWSLGLCAAIWALFLSDSRSGLLVGLVSLAVSILVTVASTRARLIMLPLLIMAGIVAVNWIPPLLAGTRLVQGAAQSDLARTQINAEAVGEFLSNPFVGGGFAALGGVAVPLQVISAGGIVLAIGYYLFVLWPLPTLLRTVDDLLSKTALLALVTLLAFGIFNPVILERAAFWPALIGLFAARSMAGTLPPLEPWLLPRRS